MDVTSYMLGKKAGGGGEAPSLQNKSVTITENGTQNVTADSGYDGLRNVEVTTNVSGGDDLSEYFVTEITENGINYGTPQKFIKKTPVINIADNVTNMIGWFSYTAAEEVSLTGGNNVTNYGSLFRGSKNLKKINLDINTSNCTTLTNVFYNCSKLIEADLSNLDLSNINQITELFQGCTSIQKIDIRTLPLSKITSSYVYSGAFTNVPNDCEIIVSTDADKEWFTGKFDNLTNVKTVAEYEAEQA